MGIFSARRMNTSCLRCHGDPKDAPTSLIKEYGDKAGFYRPIGEIIGMDVVAIPLRKITEGLWSKSKTLFFLLSVHCYCSFSVQYSLCALLSSNA